MLEEMFVANQATVEPDDVEDIIALLREKTDPQPLDVLLERYVARLKERAMKEIEAAPANQ